MTDLEVANVVGMITYQQELDLAALAETFDERDEITDVTYEPADNHWLQTHFAPTTRTSPSIGPGAVRLLAVDPSSTSKRWLTV